MTDDRLIRIIVEEIERAGFSPRPAAEPAEELCQPQAALRPQAEETGSYEALRRMQRATPARIGMGRCGPRLKTEALLQFRADHAAAKDSVMREVDEALLERLGLFTVSTCCRDRNEYLTRPDLGRTFNEAALKTIRERCVPAPRVQVYAAGGLSSEAVQANLENILPSLLDGLEYRGITAGTPFYVRFARVASMDMVSQALDAEVTCVLIGERPGLNTAESMSAYIAYNPRVGMEESRRTVVSNIHRGGIPAVEAGAYLVDLIKTICDARASGVDLRRDAA